MTKENTANTNKAYTDEQALEIVNMYNAGQGATVEEIAEKFDKSKRSVIGLLAQRKVYVKPEPAQSAKTKGVRKIDLADEITTKLEQCDNPDLANLATNPHWEAGKMAESVSKTVLTGIIAMLDAINGEQPKTNETHNEPAH